MPIPHKEVVEAYAQGREIEYKLLKESDVWFPLHSHNDDYNPITNGELEWRVVVYSVPAAEAFQVLVGDNKLDTAEFFAFKHGWEAMGNYLIHKNVIGPEDLPKIEKIK